MSAHNTSSLSQAVGLLTETHADEAQDGGHHNAANDEEDDNDERNLHGAGHVGVHQAALLAVTDDLGDVLGESQTLTVFVPTLAQT